MKCPVCGGEGHYVYNGWCEDCFAEGQQNLGLQRLWTFEDTVRSHPKGWPFKGPVIKKELPE